MEKLKADFQVTEKEIISIVNKYKEKVVPDVEKRTDYAKGNNPSILERKVPANSPDNRIPISYARRMVNLVTSYLYKPGLISYATLENADSGAEGYLDKLNEIFRYNLEPMETEQIGRQASIQGVGYELFYGEGVGEVEVNGIVGPASVIPRFVKVPISQIIPIYNFDIIPKLTHFIRFWTVKDNANEQTKEIEYIDVYDNTTIYSFSRGGESGNLAALGEYTHGFNEVPLNVFENNEDMIGDFSCVVPLIDAYDVLMSDSMNEFDRFAWAYLILKGLMMDEDNVKEIKNKRVISLMNKDDAIEFLTKDINHEFLKFMSEWIRGEIHRQSGIPNLDDYKFGTNTSGETLSKWIYLMELFTDPKESYFKQALRRRIEIITSYMNLDGDAEDINIIMNRNMPDKSMEQAELMEKYAPYISKKTLLENFADFVPDAEAEMKQKQEEEQERAQVNLDNYERRAEIFGQNNKEEEEEEEE